MIPEAAVAMLACARIGAPHSVVFGGFSAEALRSRIDDAEASVVITADGGYRRGRGDSAQARGRRGARVGAQSVRHVLVVRRTGQDVAWTEGRDVWWHEARRGASRRPTSRRPSTPSTRSSSSTPRARPGSPRGSCTPRGGYLTQVAYTYRNVFDLKPDTDVFWCTADIGWVTGHSYIVYGPLANRATQVMYEGTPDTPHKGRWWELIEKYRVSILYTAPTAIRTFMKWGERRSRRLRPVVAAAARVGGRADQPRGVDLVPPGHRRRPRPGRRHVVADRDRRDHDQPAARRHRHEARLGDAAAAGHRRRGRRRRRRRRCPTAAAATSCSPSRGRRCCAASGATRSATSRRTGRASPGRYFAGDGAKKDEDGDLWLLGRVDDVMNVSGHRISTTEVESALVSHPSVAEAAVVGADRSR